MKLGTQVGLGSGHIVLDGTQLSLPQKGAGPQFSAISVVENGWMDQDKTWHVGRLGPGHIVLDGDPVPPPQKGAEPTNFWPMSIVAKWLDGSRCHLVQT